MIFKIAWMYYDLLELYGDRGNINVFSKILDTNKIPYKIDKITITDQKIDISDYDIVFIGGGTDKAQQIVAQDLMKRKSQFQNIVRNNGFILGVCGGYQMMGEYYLDSKGNKILGLGLFPFYTKSGAKRCVGNIKIRVNTNLEVIGFENHGGETYNIGDSFFGEVIVGHGNTYDGKYEGYQTENFLGTYIHGPLLPKNPEIGKFIIQKVLRNKYQIDIKLKLNYEVEAKLARNEVKI